MDFRHNRLDVSYYEGTSLVTLRQPDAAQPVLDAALAAQDPGHLSAYTFTWGSPDFSEGCLPGVGR
jgi:hypothetical protein